MEGVTKGAEIDLPEGVSFRDHEGTERFETRIRWWDEAATNYRDAAMVPNSEKHKFPDQPLPAHVQLGCASNVPVFVGHYWLSGEPHLQSVKVGVLDFGGAIDGRPLVAYRWDGEAELRQEKLVAVGGAD